MLFFNSTYSCSSVKKNKKYFHGSVFLNLKLLKLIVRNSQKCICRYSWSDRCNNLEFHQRSWLLKSSKLLNKHEDSIEVYCAKNTKDIFTVLNRFIYSHRVTVPTYMISISWIWNYWSGKKFIKKFNSSNDCSVKRGHVIWSFETNNEGKRLRTINAYGEKCIKKLISVKMTTLVVPILDCNTHHVIWSF